VAAGTVRAASVEVSEIANRKSFQQKMNTMIALVNTAGRASGRITCRNAWNGVAPSTCAACSRSHGISRKNAARVQIASGRAKVMYGRIRPGQVSYSPVERQMLNSGPMIDTGGNIAIASAPDSSSDLPGKASRAMAYAASEAITTAVTVVMSEMPIELISGRTNSPLVKMLR